MQPPNDITANGKYKTPLLFRAGMTWCLCSGIFLLMPSLAVEYFYIACEVHNKMRNSVQYSWILLIHGLLQYIFKKQGAWRTNKRVVAIIVIWFYVIALERRGKSYLSGWR